MKLAPNYYEKIAKIIWKDGRNYTKKMAESIVKMASKYSLIQNGKDYNSQLLKRNI
jgi:hypothetical protein